MKKQTLILSTVVLFTIGSTTLIGCGDSVHKEHETIEVETVEQHEDMETSDEHADHARYHCPMDCEGEKNYDDSGICPECEMDLVEVE